VEILDMENRVVRHLFEGYEASGPRIWESHLHVWDEKADNGELCPDEPYYYRIEVSDLATNENHSIGEVVLDARLFHIKGASFSPGKFNPEEEKTTLSYWLSEPAKALSIAIYDSFGNLVRHLVVREPRPAGLSTEVWDERGDSGELVGGSLYEARIWAVSHAGEGAEAVAKVSVVRLAAPELKIPSAPFRIREALFHPLCFNPELGENTGLRYELPERALVGAIIYRITTGFLENFYVLEGEHEERVDGCYLYVKYWAGFYYKEVRLEVHPIRHLVFNETRDAGSNVETWDGLDDDGNLVPSGWYFCRLVALSEKGEGDIVTRVVKVDRKMPVILNVSDSPDPFSPNGDGVDDTTKISYELRVPKDAPTDWLDVAIVIYRKGLEFELFDQEVKIPAKYIVRIVKLKQRTGPNFWIWDGRDFLGKIVPNGTYGYLIFASSTLSLNQDILVSLALGWRTQKVEKSELRVSNLDSYDRQKSSPLGFGELGKG
jgi:flagellar hook assembly protein FlgD